MGKNDMIYRFYEERDYDRGLSDILFQGYKSTISQMLLEEKYVRDDRNIAIAYDNVNARVAGCAFWEVRVDYVRPGRTLYVSYVVVDEAYRRQGIGSALCQKLEAVCKEKNCSNIELTSARFREYAHKFYYSLGYQEKQTIVFIKEMQDNK